MKIHSNLLQAESSLLVIVDLQSKLFAAMNQQDISEVSKHTQRLLKASSRLNIPVLVTEQYPNGLGNTDRHISDLFTPETKVFEKTGFSCCASDEFMNALSLSERKQIVLVGQETHVCVLQTALELLEHNLEVYVVEDAVCSRKSQHKTNALQRMQQHEISITNHESVLFEWMRDAKHPQFKAISTLLRD